VAKLCVRVVIAWGRDWRDLLFGGGKKGLRNARHPLIDPSRDSILKGGQGKVRSVGRIKRINGRPSSRFEEKLTK